MRCPKCHSDNFRTIDSRDYFNNRIRRRKACICGYRWATIEYIEKAAHENKMFRRVCKYLGCNRNAFSKSNNAMYCNIHKKKWADFLWKRWRARKQGKEIIVPKEFNRKV